MTIKSTFDNYSAEYDGGRRKLIPCFDDFYGTAIAIIPFAKERKLRVLDIGAGTGLVSEMVALAFPHSEITLVDVSGKMLAIAKTRLSKFKNQIEYREEDYSQWQIQGKYDLIISALSIHHLNEEEKKELFRNCYHALSSGGLFVNADQILGETHNIEKMYRQKWLEEIKNNGVSESELESAFERMKEDKMSTLPYQLSCLKEIGFVETTCWYQNFSFAVFSGTRT